MSEHVDGRFTGSAGAEIYWQAWTPDAVAGVVVIAHGYAEHGGRYEHVAERLCAAGYAAYVPDFHGHGRSGGSRANVNRISDAVADLDKVVRLAAEQHPDQPLFLLGHSMGTLIALDYVTGAPFELRGLALSGALIDVAVGSKAERIAAKLMSSVVPNLPVTPFKSTLISRDPEVVAAYDGDPLNYHGRIKVRAGAEVLAGIDRIKARLADVRLPVLLMHGTGDQVNLPSGSQVVADRSSSEDVTLKWYDGLYHEVFNEPERDTVLDDLVDWLKQRT